MTEQLLVRFEREWLASLNDKQREAVENLQGPLLVLAGAGTGKTRVLTVRLAMLVLEKCAYPSQILAATFTNKAAREITQRVESLLGEDAHRMALGTFHSLSVKLLRRYGDAIGMRRDFTIIDTEDQVRLLKEILQDMSLLADRSTARGLVWCIQRWKDRALIPDSVPEEEAQMFADGRAREVYRIYQKRLLAIGACDFGDLILQCVELLRNKNNILQECREKYRYLLIDEYQDTNIAQYLWMRLLAEGHKNLCCVGDDDQSIYGWRGAEVGNILRFEKDFPEAHVVRLERNYRSKPHILSAAAGLIPSNKQRMGKTLWTEEAENDKNSELANAQELVSIRGFYDGESEARFVAEEIESLRRKRQVTYGEVAILLRTIAQMRVFEEAFLYHDIPYRVVGGARFYEREEIRDVIAYLRSCAQSSDDLAFMRIVNKPARGIGNVSLRKLSYFARQRGMPMQEAVNSALEEGIVKGRAASALAELKEKLEEWRGDIAHLPLRQLAEKIVEQSGYAQYWRDKADEQSRTENIRELFSALHEVENLESFLEHVALVADGEDNSLEGRVGVMTMHAAKGLEFDAVFLPGWEEGLFPMQRSLEEKGEKALEEERRLAYVALTRARKYVMVGHAQARRIFGQVRSASPSRFIAEIPKEVVEISDERVVNFYPQNNRAYQKHYNKLAQAKHFPQAMQVAPSHQQEEVSSGYAAEQAAQPIQQEAAKLITENNFEIHSRHKVAVLKVGSRCKHAQLGEGMVVVVEKNSLTVAFPNKGVYYIDPDYVVAID